MDVIVQRVDLSLKTRAMLAMADHIEAVGLERGVIPSQCRSFSQQPGVFLRQRFFSHGSTSL
jgi:hypothetical protein